MTRYLGITLSHPGRHGRSKSLCYRLHDADIVSRFVRLIDTANLEGADLTTSWGMYVNDAHVPDLIKRMDELIEQFNAAPGPGSEFPRIMSDRIDQETLNTVHDLFDHNIYTLEDTLRNASRQSSKDASTVWQSKTLHEINHLVHRLESSIEIEHYRNENLICAWFSTRFWQSGGHDYCNVPLQEEEFSLFVLSEQFGGLYLNYARHGKCLYDAYLSDDLELLKSPSRIRPQTSMEAGAISFFGNYSKHHETELKRFYDWWDRNDVGAFGLKKYDPRNTLGRIPVGQIVPSADNRDLYDPQSGQFDEFAFVDRYSAYSEVSAMKCLTTPLP